ncbi:unnamed protein product [Plutella xylostella]|uniref:(diamondback moth) hypothetical protein n=1 Tax=Plutella xylostella TaxID=51655 RepID=A0A8S4E897_PLUXY|nr:unnamed protein product [Plutella xylostella]
MLGLRSPQKGTSTSNPDITADFDSSTRKRKQPADDIMFAFENLSEKLLSKISNLKLEIESNMAAIQNNMQDMVKAELNSFSSGLSDFKTELNSSMQKIQDKQTEMQVDINDLKISMEFTSKQYDDVDKWIKTAQSGFKSIETNSEEISELRMQVTDLKMELNNQQQRDRLDNIEISGLPEIKK